MGRKNPFVIKLGLHNRNYSIIMKLLIAIIVQPMNCLASFLWDHFQCCAALAYNCKIVDYINKGASDAINL
jgi:hypothetical protein